MPKTLKEKIRGKAVKKLVKQMILACPKCGAPNSVCPHDCQAIPMTKGNAADLAIWNFMDELLKR